MRGHHAFEACVEQLATAIRLGVYPRGSALPPERDLAERLQVSRATLREAMAALREAGLVETTRGRGGGTVVTLKPRHAVGPRGRPDHRGAPRGAGCDALVFRRIVEPGAAALAASRRRSTTSRAGPARARRTPRSRRPRKPAEHRQADSRFHLTVAALTDSPRTVEAVTSVQSTCTRCCWRSRCWTPTSPTPTASTRALVRAILAGDADRARAVMEEHCDDTAALLRGLRGLGADRQHAETR